MKGSDMADAMCSRGLTERADETMTDHLLAVFTPEDSRGRDGELHEEWQVTRSCSCGVATTTPAQLGAHFLAMFSAAMSRAARGPMVLMSMPMVPGSQASSRPPGPAQTDKAAGPSDSMVMMTSLPAASSRGEAATRAPRPASGVVCPAVRVQIVSGNP